VGLGQMQKLLLKPLFTKYLAMKACKMLAVRKNNNKYFLKSYLPLISLDIAI
jgi:hypothetical protein